MFQFMEMLYKEVPLVFQYPAATLPSMIIMLVEKVLVSVFRLQVV